MRDTANSLNYTEALIPIAGSRESSLVTALSRDPLTTHHASQPVWLLVPLRRSI